MLLALNRYEIDLSNEVLSFDFSQDAAKIWEINVSGRQKNLPVQPGPDASVSYLAESEIVFFLQL